MMMSLVVLNQTVCYANVLNQTVCYDSSLCVSDVLSS